MDNKVHVLIVVDYINSNSGVSSVVMNYYSHIDHLKIQMDFLLYKEPEEEYLEYFQKFGSRVYFSGYPSEIGLRHYEKEIKNFFKTHKNEYTVVHVHIPNAAFVVLKYAKKYGVKTRIIHSHNSRGADNRFKKMRNYLLNKIGISYANQYFACSKSAGEYLYGKKKNSQIVVINNAIELDKYCYNPESRTTIRKQLAVGDEILLGHVGRFSEQKNHRFLIEVANQLKKADFKFKLLLIGGGELEKDIRRQIEESNLNEFVIFTGIVNNVKEYMDAMDIFLLPSLYEGLPCVCVEAQANGLPCILSLNITREVELTDSIRFMNIEDPAVWADMVMKMFDSGEVREKRHNNRKVTLSNYDIVVQGKNLEERYLSYGNSTGINVNL